MATISVRIDKLKLQTNYYIILKVNVFTGFIIEKHKDYFNLMSLFNGYTIPTLIYKEKQFSPHGRIKKNIYTLNNFISIYVFAYPKFPPEINDLINQF
jgi:hypothetical protein